MSLKKTIGLQSAANIISAASQWAFLVLLARFTTPETVGLYVLSTAISWPVFLLFNCNLRSILIVDVKNGFHLESYFFTRLATSLLALAVLFIYSFFFEKGSVLVFTLVSATKFLEAITDIGFAGYQKKACITPIVYSRLAKALMLLPLSLGLLFLSLESVLFMQVLLSSLITFLWDIRSINILSRPKRGEIFSLVKKGYLLGVAASLDSVVMNIPKYVIKSVLGVRSLAIFSASANLLQVGAPVQSAISVTLAPQFATLINHGKTSEATKLLSRAVFFILIACVLMSPIAYLLGSTIVAGIFGQKYVVTPLGLLFLLWGGAFWYSSGILMSYLNAHNLHSFQLPLNIVALIGSGILAYPLIERFSVTGGFAIILLGYGIKFCAQLFLSYSYSAKIKNQTMELEY